MGTRGDIKFLKRMKRFFDKVNKTGNCWEWQASKIDGYGAFKLDGKTQGAHRVSWGLHNGPIPDGLMVCHKCDNRGCVNPGHLFLGTHSDNMKDCYAKGRMILPTKSRFKEGNKPVTSFLKSKEKITYIKKAIENRSGSLKDLSEDLDVPYQLIRDINCGRVYK